LEAVESKRERRARCTKVLQRMLHLQLARAWDLFSQAAEQLRVQAAIISRTLVKWRTPLLAWGFMEWVDAVGELRAAAQEAAHELAKQRLAAQVEEEVERGAEKTQREAERRLHMCAAAVKRMFHIQLALAFDALRDRVATCKEKKASCKRLIHRMLHTNLAAAFDGFAEAVEQLAAHRALVLKTVARWQAPLKHVGFERWLAYLDAAKASRAQEAAELAQRRLGEEVEAKEARYAALPVAVALKYDLDFDVAFRDPAAAAQFDAQVQEEVSAALSIPPAAVEVMCHQRGSVIAEVVLHQRPAPGGGIGGAGDCRTAALLAAELVEMAGSPGSDLLQKPLGQFVQAATVDGPVSEAVCALVCKALRGRGADWHAKLEACSGSLNAKLDQVYIFLTR
jgi:hypothetical protein